MSTLFYVYKWSLFKEQKQLFFCNAVQEKKRKKFTKIVKKKKRL